MSLWKFKLAVVMAIKMRPSTLVLCEHFMAPGACRLLRLQSPWARAFALPRHKERCDKSCMRSSCRLEMAVGSRETVQRTCTSYAWVASGLRPSRLAWHPANGSGRCTGILGMQRQHQHIVCSDRILQRYGDHSQLQIAAALFCSFILATWAAAEVPRLQELRSQVLEPFLYLSISQSRHQTHRVFKLGNMPDRGPRRVKAYRQSQNQGTG